MHNFKNKKIIITGNTGFKGSWLTCWLLELGADLYGISKDIPTEPSMFKSLDLENKINHFYEDINNFESIKTIINNIKPDFIFHMAAQAIVTKSYINPLETINTNVLGTANILEVLRTLNLDCVAVIITSDKCYENIEWEWGYKETDRLGGKDIYSASKGAAEVIFHSYYHSYFKNRDIYKTKLVSVRAGNVIGGGDWAQKRIVPDCIKAWVNKSNVEIRSPDATRPWQHVLEPLSGYLAIADKLYNDISLNGDSYNFGPTSEYNKSVVDLIDDLSKYWNLNRSPYKISKEKVIFHEAGLLKLNCDKALFHIKWLPTLDYEELIKYTSTWYNNFYNNKNIDMLEFTRDQIKDYIKLASKKNIKWAMKN